MPDHDRIPPRKVNVRKGQTVRLEAGRGCVLELERDAAGAVILRNINTGAILRQWSPKEAKTP